MATSGAVWAIDVGNCALKALKCRAHESESMVVAEAFDYIEYPKILTQPGAEPTELILDALRQFLSRNSVQNDRVAVSVSGQAGLARFIKLPPVEARKIPDIVRYEAKQQIPFDLNDVVWDYQRLSGGSEEGFALETEVGLFAMKRDVAARSIDPFERVGIDVDLLQLAPLAIYNFVLFDQLTELPPPEEYDPDDPPESIVVISMGTDSTDLVITNGFRVWQRSVPIGGGHFTKALTKELKLTFAKAEHLKRNAATAQDTKAVFQAMRPVFNDLLTELQRSIGYFSSLDRNAKIGRVVAIGNAMKLPGLRRYLSQNLGFEIERIDEFNRLVGPSVLAAPAFKDNTLAFSVCYGLAVQALNRGKLKTNLLPREIVKDRLIRAKKPWAVAAAALLLLACTLSFVKYSVALNSVDASRRVDGVAWSEAESKSDSLVQRASNLRSEDQAVRGEFETINQIGKHLVGGVEGRVIWLEALKVLNEALPRELSDERPENVEHRRELHIRAIDCHYVPDLAAWFAGVKQWYQPSPDEAKAAAGAAAGDSEAPGQSAPAAGAAGGIGDAGAAPSEGPSGPGWVIQLIGYHHHNDLNKFGSRGIGPEYVRNEFISKLQTGKFKLPRMDEKGEIVMEEVSAKELGFEYVTLIDPRKIEKVSIPDPKLPPGATVPGGGDSATGGSKTIDVMQFNFRIEMCWRKTPPTERYLKRLEAALAAAEGAPPAGGQ